MNAAIVRRSAASKEAPNQSGTAPNTASASASAPTPPNNFPQGIMFPGSAFPFPGYFNGIYPSLMAMYPPTAFGYNPFIRPPGHGYDGVGIYGAPPSPARPEVALNYPQVTTWFESHVDTNPERVSDGESYAHFGPILERAGFRQINQLVSNKDVRVTAETLKGLNIEVGFGTNILQWAAADSAKADCEHARAQHQRWAMQPSAYEGWNT